MDLSFNHKAWVGDICQRFENICQQVDDFVSQAVGVGIGEKDIAPIVEQDIVKHEELTSHPEVSTNIYNDPLESCAVKDSLKDADIESYAAMLSQSKDPVVQSNVKLETIALTEKQTALDLSSSEDKNFSGECVFTELLANKTSSGEEESCCNPVNSIFGVSESWSTLDSDKTDVETGLTVSDSVLSLKSSATASGRTDANILLNESHIHDEKDGWNLDQIEDLISSSETVKVDLSGRNSEASSSMENITLSDEENLHESCVVVHSTPVYSFSSRPRKYKSYKKIIQDVFNSRKSIVKEYEQLEILYGDIENDKDEIRAVIANKTIKAKISASEESEWEVV